MYRSSIAVRGVVQGVGFRPFVYGLATRHALSGFVKNQPEGVTIEIEGDRQALQSFLNELQTQPPPLARIESISSRAVRPLGERGFRIDPSDSRMPSEARLSFIAPDVATCDDCLRELFDPHDRRFRYPFINCTNCGPRLTIIQGAPYDRPRTTMAGFPMCPACKAEYENPSDRRFHAQPIACPECGPRLELLQSDGKRIETSDPLVLFAEAVRAGKIGALKGLGGYHLVCDAGSSLAVAELRRRKQREEKPLAIMVANISAARRICRIYSSEQRLLESTARPIVLLRRRPGVYDVCEGVAPGNRDLGVVLPYTPLHHLLLDLLPGVPLVMTSGNLTDEPIAFEDDDALDRLGRIADLFLTSNRPIHVRCDDSVVKVVAGSTTQIRRSRGYAPLPIKLPIACPAPTLAVGGQLKGAFGLATANQAFLSHHLGDLDQFEAFRQFQRDVLLYEELFGIMPATIVYDLHPDYASTRYARHLAAGEEVQLLPVQHHHAHMASCMAENGVHERVIGVTFDGTGFGIDEASGEPTIWGGEFLLGDYRQFRRVAHLRNVALPGGDRAARETWRMAASHLLDAGEPLAAIENRISRSALHTVEQMIARRINTPQASSMGRLFDAVASIAGVRDVNAYEGQAAMHLEWLASDCTAEEAYQFEIQPSGENLPSVIDTRPLIRGVADDARNCVKANIIARRFHTTLVEIVISVCRQLRAEHEVDAVVLSGGVFLNAILACEVFGGLTADRFRVFRHRQVPPNDGGLCLGQLAVAAATLAGTATRHTSTIGIAT